MYRVDASPVTVRLAVWSDRWIWLDARRRGKRGWAWFTTLEGRYIGKNGPDGLVRQLEQIFTAGLDDDPVRRIGQIWNPILAKGPRLEAG
jgi:hypothetical protein